MNDAIKTFHRGLPRGIPESIAPSFSEGYSADGETQSLAYFHYNMLFPVRPQDICGKSGYTKSSRAKPRRLPVRRGFDEGKIPYRI
jgi:hypothetical protein